MKSAFLILIVLIYLAGCAVSPSSDSTSICSDYHTAQEREYCYKLNIRYAVEQKLRYEPYYGFFPLEGNLPFNYFARYDMVLEAKLNEFGQVKDVVVLKHSGDNYRHELIAEAIVDEGPFILQPDNSTRSIIYACYYGAPLCEVDIEHTMLSALY